MNRKWSVFAVGASSHRFDVIRRCWAAASKSSMHFADTSIEDLKRAQIFGSF
jgi:hypothetical protein